MHRLLALLAALTLSLAACDDGGSPPAPSATASFTHGVASGDVTPTSAVLWTRAEGGDTVLAEVATDASFSGGLTTFEAATSAERDFTVKAYATGLTPDTRYYYRFRAGDATSEAGAFVTAPAADASKPLRFVFAGDSDGTRNADGSPVFNEFEVLTAAQAEDPAFFLYFGDTIYADRGVHATTLDGYRAKYRANRAYPALRNILAATSTVNMWDDHEVVNDYAGAAIDRDMFEAGRQAFREYLPVDDSAGDPALLYRALRWGADIELIVLDERSFRSASAADACSVAGAPDTLPAAAAPGAPDSVRGIRGFVGLPETVPAGCLEAIDDSARTMLGDEQKRFLFDRLRNSDATWRVIVNEVPVQQLLALPYDRWEGYAAERREILEFIRNNKIPNVVFLTTDMHANIFGPVRIDPFTDKEPIAYEAVVGPIATTPLERDIVDAIGETGAGLFGAFLTGLIGVDCAELKSYSYGLVEVDPAAGTMTITAKDAAGAALCEKTLEAVR